MRTLELPVGPTPRDWGRIHGETFRDEIARLAAIRLELSIEVGGFSGPAPVRVVAEAHLPVLQAYDEALYEELLGIAEGAATTPAELVVLNHYTDLRDLGLHERELALDGRVAADGCTAVYARNPDATLLGQTWDTHGSATEFVMLLKVPERGDRPAAWLLSVTGCLGMAGLNSAGVGVVINNLKSVDAGVGLVWSALIRKVLEERSAAAARDRVCDAPIGSGHHYLVADTAAAFGIETSGRTLEVVFDGARDRFVHTNHCFDPVVEAESRVAPGSTTFSRLRTMSAHVEADKPGDLAALWERFNDHEDHPGGICAHLATEDNPHGVATCAALAMDLTARRAFAKTGCLREGRPVGFGFAGES